MSDCCGFVLFIGLVYDVTQNYDPPLYVAGVFIMASALILLPIPVLMGRKQTTRGQCECDVIAAEATT